MRENKIQVHVVSAMLFSLAMLIVTFSTDSPVIIATNLAVCVVVLLFCKQHKKATGVFKYFLPFALVTMMINMMFVWNGSIVLFTLFGKPYTLEALIYAVILALKLLITMYLFMILGIMIDSDRAVSYFSGKMPKSTLTLMISLKLFPNMRERLKILKETYTIRGVDFEKKGLTNKIRAYVPMLSILLEDSLEGAFDIGEAAYVKGFLSGKRSVYDEQKHTLRDKVLILQSCFIVVLLIMLKMNNGDAFDIYEGFENVRLASMPLAVASALILSTCLTLFVPNKRFIEDGDANEA